MKLGGILGGVKSAMKSAVSGTASVIGKFANKAVALVKTEKPDIPEEQNSFEAQALKERSISDPMRKLNYLKAQNMQLLVDDLPYNDQLILSEHMDELDAAIESHIKAKVEVIEQNLVEIETTSDESVLFEPGRLQKTAMALEIAKALISHDTGKLDVFMLDYLLENLPEGPSKAHNAYTKRILTKLKNNPALRFQLEDLVNATPLNKSAERVVQATLKKGTIDPEDLPVAALAGMLADLRQIEAGTCFITSCAIRLRDCAPELYLNDLKDLFQTGELKRTTPDGYTETYTLSYEVESSVLRDKKIVNFYNDDFDRPDQVDALVDDKSFHSLLQKLGIDSSILKDAMPELKELLATGMRPGGYSIEGPIDVKLRKLLKDHPFLEGEGLEKQIQLVCQFDPSKGQSLVDYVAELRADNRGLSFASVTAVLSVQLTSKIPVTEILTFLGQKQFGVSIADVKKYQQMDRFAREIKNINGKLALNPSNVKLHDTLNKKIDQYDAIIKEFAADKKLQDFGTYMNLVKDAEWEQVSYDDNMLIKTWEYTLAQMGVNPGSDMTVLTRYSIFPHAESSANQVLNNVLSKAIAKSSDDPDSAESLKNTFISTFHNVFHNNIVGTYAKGGFYLHDTSGAESREDYQRIDSEAKFKEVITGLIMTTQAELIEEDPSLKDTVRAVVSELNKFIKTDKFVKDFLEEFGQWHEAGSRPWQNTEGASDSMFYENYFGVKAPEASSAVISTTDPLGMAANIISTGRDLLAQGYDIFDESFMVTASTSHHCVNLIFTDPQLRQAIESTENPEDWMKENLSRLSKPMVLMDTNWGDEKSPEHSFGGIVLDKEGKPKLRVIDEDGDIAENAGELFESSEPELIFNTNLDQTGQPKTLEPTQPKILEQD